MKGPTINVMSILLLLGAAQGVCLALVLARVKSGNRIANRFLALLLLVFSIGLVAAFMSITYSYLRYPHSIGIQWPMMFLYGPLAYFYVKALTRPHGRLQRLRLIVHFVPAVLLYLYLIPFFLSTPEAKARAWLIGNSHLKNYSPAVDPIAFVVIIQIAGYLILSLRLLKIHAKTIRRIFSSIENINLLWLRNLLIVFFYLLCAWTFFAVFSQFYGIYKETEYLNNLIVAVVIYVMGYKGLTQPEIFAAGETLPVSENSTQGDPPLNKPDSAPDKRATGEENGQAQKYKKSALSEEQADKMVFQLRGIMEKEKPYLETGLTLPMLARMLDISPHRLSQVINAKLNKTFFDFVNEYRVEEAKRALISPESDRFSIRGIAVDAGFNSKNAFYSAFKKSTGMTPSQFRDRQTTAEQA